MTEKTVSVEEVLKHNTREDLWIVVKDNVFDITKFIEAHPGGEEVLVDLAGQDASGPFEDVGHSEDAQEMLKNFHVGKLVKTEGGPELPTKGAFSDSKCYDSSQPIHPAMWIFVVAMIGAYIAFRTYFIK
ncbi:cytochrome b5 [Schizosaccharomyces cryophilus OY26]|uniref:Cytochrome b5 n=1 Tax=Schizosaccharomyces cryophilus (strain OY26 / ATCC MYA-4695 / CBS 11777 / NBRC 106824 / NRRL Y48691) TaxID=653667 RepID=S9X7M9_SCHCR|nr:cytochrome b5 [Schizosaccharomyces cryophilus OY26]EPY49791.1 cytochrome b5 [Schizosaccharomyces cryophilus OY26]